MIKLRLQSFESPEGELTVPTIHGEVLTSAITRATAHIPLEGRTHQEIFKAVVNGFVIPADMWSCVYVKDEDEVIIILAIMSGENGAIFKQFAILVITAAAYTYFPPAGGFVNAMLVAGISIGSTLAINALFPPPVLDNSNNLGGDSNLSSSQMYSISGQSNAYRKFQTVPKVYGNHRVFPVVAANPYTVLEVDSDTNEIVQYLYAIYDFGLGPMTIEDIRIGDTPITDYTKVFPRLVDLNRPAVDEGPWDNGVESDFQYYKSDVQTENVAVALDGNQSGGGAVDTYEALRTLPPNLTNSEQEITLTFINPQGLIAYASNGSEGPRSINLDIYFSKEGENVWRPYNDPAFVRDFNFVGGDETYTDTDMELLPFGDIAPETGTTPDFPQSITDGIYVQSEPVKVQSHIEYFGYAGNPLPNGGDSIFVPFGAWADVYSFGLEKDVSNSICLKTNTTIIPGDIISFQGKQVGVVASTASVPGYPEYTRYIFTEAVKQSYTFFKMGVTTQTFVGPHRLQRGLDTSSLNKIVRRVRVLGRARITRQESSPCYSSVSFIPLQNAQYKVRVTRVSSFSTNTTQIRDNLTWAGISSRFNSPVIVTDKRHLFYELKIRATNQLNGTISNLSAVAKSVLDVWDGTNWVKQPTSNPAWVYTDLLTGQTNKKPLDKSRLHLPSIVEWADFCDEIPPSGPSVDYNFPRFQCNFILDYDSTLQGVINQVTSAAQASLNIYNGKYGVLIDKLRTTPVQIFTPRNSTNFTSSRVYTRKPHCLRVKYVDPGREWDVQELLVYDDGYDELTATEFDDITSFAVTNTEQAFRFGRYLLAQNRLRQETISIKVDYEHLVCNRGDYVQITQDTMKVGGTPARVKSITGNQVVIDDGIETSNLLNYGFVFRAITGDIHTSTLTVVNSTTFDLDGSNLPEVGDLIIIGEVGKIVFDCIVKSITPEDDMSAGLVLIERAAAVYDAESGADFPFYDPQINSTTNPNFAPPGEVETLTVIDNSFECSGEDYQYYVTLDWDAPTGSAYELFEVYANTGQGFDLVGSTRESIFKYIVNPVRLDKEHTFKVLAVSVSGNKLDLAAVTAVSATPTYKSTPPGDVESLATDITNEVLQLSWPQVETCDIQEYLIRYSPTLTGTWTGSIPLLRANKNATSASTQARVGTYLIKAVDFNGNESATAAVAITTIPSLVNLNAISEVTDFPDLLGTKDRTVASGGQLLLQNTIPGEYFSEGFYYYKELLDLEDIYTVRLQSLIQAEGFTQEDLMSNWVTLSSVALLANAGTSQWDVEAQYRTSSQFNSIADWVSLDTVEVLSVGAQENFTEWKKFVMNDATGRIFQFRLRLISNQVSVTPRVYDGTIKADIPDRVERFENLTAPTSGLVVDYSTGFKGPGTTPNIQISLESGNSGDYWSFDYKNLDGFKIRFFDKDDLAVVRTFDAAILGFGRKATSVI